MTTDNGFPIIQTVRRLVAYSAALARTQEVMHATPMGSRMENAWYALEEKRDNLLDKLTRYRKCHYMPKGYRSARLAQLRKAYQYLGVSKDSRAYIL